MSEHDKMPYGELESDFNGLGLSEYFGSRVNDTHSIPAGHREILEASMLTLRIAAGIALAEENALGYRPRSYGFHHHKT